MSNKSGGALDFVQSRVENFRRGNNKKPYSISADGPTRGYVDPKPYWEVTTDGRFSTYQWGRWTYYKFPENVDIGRAGRSNVASQRFLNDVFRALADNLNSESSKITGDLTRDFQISMIRDKQMYATNAPGMTIQQRDYENRLERKLKREKFYGYFGVEHLTETTSIEDKLNPSSLMTRIMDKGQYKMNLFNLDERLTDEIMRSANFTNLDLDTVEGMSDYSRITAWHGIADQEYFSSRSLSNTKMCLYDHGYSLWTEKWGEIEFLSIGPEDSDSILKVDPNSDVIRFADTLFQPSNDVVGIWIRGKILGQDATQTIIDSKVKEAGNELANIQRLVQEGRTEKGDSSKISATEIDNAQYRQNRAESSREGISYRLPMLDNVEILVAVKVRPGILNDRVLKDSGENLNDLMRKRHKLAVRPIRGRQDKAFQSTFPGSPVRIDKSPKFNRVRPELQNQFYPGILSFSGIARNASLASEKGPIVGFEDSPEKTTVRAHVEDPSIHGGSVGFGVFGQTGSGKALHVDEPIMTPHGVVPIGQINPGDTVLSGSGEPTTVDFVTNISYDHDTFEMEFTDGQKIIADADHQWVVRSSVMAGFNTIYLSEVESIMLMEIADTASSGGLGGKISSEAIAAGFGDTPVWNRPEFIEAAIGFARGGNISVGENENGYKVYVRQQAVLALLERVRGMYADIPGDEEDVYLRVTTAELLHSGIFDKVKLPPQEVIEGTPRALPVTPRTYGMAIGGMVTRRSDYSSTEVAEAIEEVRDAGLPLTGVSPALYTSSVTDRVAFLDGFMSVSGFETEGGFGFTDFTMDPVLDDARDSSEDVDGDVEAGLHVGLVDVSYITRSLSLFTEKRDGIASVTVMDDIAFDWDHGSARDTPALKITSIKKIDSVPVRCIGVSDPSRTFLVAGNITTSNTQFMLNYGVQASKLGYRWIYMNPPKTEDTTLGHFFRHSSVGGIMVELKHSALEANPGILDPFAFYADTEPPEVVAARVSRLSSKERTEIKERFVRERGNIGSIAYENISRALNLKREDLSDSERNQTLRQELNSNSRNKNNKCLGDVIFGNRQRGVTNPDEVTDGISNAQIRDLVSKMMGGSPFWKAFVSMRPVDPKDSELRRAIDEADSGSHGPRPICIEWDTTMKLPADGTDELNEAELDAVLNVQTTFQYAMHMVAKDRRGGLVAFDEAHLLMNSESIVSYLDTQNRVMREGNATIMLGSQSIVDLDRSQSAKGGRNLLSRIGRFVFLDMGERPTDAEWKAFEDYSGCGELTERLKYYMTHASYKHTGGKMTRGWYNDSVLQTSFAGKIMLVYPQQELDAGRTDKGGYDLRAADKKK